MAHTKAGQHSAPPVPGFCKGAMQNDVHLQCIAQVLTMSEHLQYFLTVVFSHPQAIVSDLPERRMPAKRSWSA